MASIRKIFSEKGIVIGIEFKEKQEANKFRNSKGEEVEIKEKPDRYIVKVVSSSTFDGDKGMVTPSYGELEVDEKSFEMLFSMLKNNKFKYLDEINVDLEMTLSGIKMLGISKVQK